MSLVVVAWYPRSAKASTAASTIRRGVSIRSTKASEASAPGGMGTPRWCRRTSLTGPVRNGRLAGEQALSHPLEVPVRRTLFSEEHEALRATAKEFLARHVVPHMDEFIESRGLP